MCMDHKRLRISSFIEYHHWYYHRYNHHVHSYQYPGNIPSARNGTCRANRLHRRLSCRQRLGNKLTGWWNFLNVWGWYWISITWVPFSFWLIEGPSTVYWRIIPWRLRYIWDLCWEKGGGRLQVKPNSKNLFFREKKGAIVIIFIFNNAHDDFQGSCDSEEVSELRGAKQLQLGGGSSRRRRQRLVVHRKHLCPGKFLLIIWEWH